MPVTLADHKPTTLDEAVDILFNGLDSDEIEMIMDAREDDGHMIPLGAIMHHGVMMAVRNQWGLWRGDGPLRKHFETVYGLGHADDMSGLIQGKLLARVRLEPFDVDAAVERYKQHWRDLGIDPLRQEALRDPPAPVQIIRHRTFTWFGWATSLFRGRREART